MNNYDYNIIKISIINWYNKILIKENPENDIAILQNNDDNLVIDFTYSNCIAQLSVTNSKYNPYQYVYFEAFDSRASDLEEIIPIYCFYDNDTMKVEDVILGLNNAMKFCLNYNGRDI